MLYFTLNLHQLSELCSEAAEQRYGRENNDITVLVAVESFDLLFGFLDAKRGLTGVRSAQSCTVL